MMAAVFLWKGLLNMYDSAFTKLENKNLRWAVYLILIIVMLAVHQTQVFFFIGNTHTCTYHVIRTFNGCESVTWLTTLHYEACLVMRSSYGSGGRGYLFPCFPEINLFVPCSPKLIDWLICYILCSPKIYFVPLFPSVLDSCSPEINALIPLFPKTRA